MAKEPSVARERDVQDLRNALRNFSDEEVRDAMVRLYTAQPDNQKLIELGNQYSEELKRRQRE